MSLGRGLEPLASVPLIVMLLIKPRSSPNNDIFSGSRLQREYIKCRRGKIGFRSTFNTTFIRPTSTDSSGLYTFNTTFISSLKDGSSFFKFSLKNRFCHSLINCYIIAQKLIEFLFKHKIDAFMYVFFIFFKKRISQ